MIKNYNIKSWTDIQEVVEASWKTAENWCAQKIKHDVYCLITFHKLNIGKKLTEISFNQVICFYLLLSFLQADYEFIRMYY